MLKLPVALELSAVIVGALSGGAHAVKRGADIIGIFVLALSTSVGGGMLRDVLLGAGPPIALTHPSYLIVVAAAAFVTLLLAPWLARVVRHIEGLDALLLGLWTVIGVERAAAYHMPLAAVMFLGTITATGGGVIRDVLSGEPPAVLLKGELLVTAAFLGAAIGAVMGRISWVPPLLGEAATIATAAGVRLAAMRWHITSPTPDDIERWRRSRRG
jgi:uncharacterized membrane protein YeiH